MTDLLHYFAYGSNLHPLRLRQRVPTARVLGVAELTGHVLRFHKRGQDGSAKCDAFATGRREDRLIGVVYTMAAAEKPLLDRVEGLGRGYDQAVVEVVCAGSACEAFFYRADPAHIDPSLKPFDWYKGLVLAGSRHHRLPDDYVRAIESIEAVADLDAGRAELHRRLLELTREQGPGPGT